MYREERKSALLSEDAEAQRKFFRDWKLHPDPDADRFQAQVMTMRAVTGDLPDEVRVAAAQWLEDHRPWTEEYIAKVEKALAEEGLGSTEEQAVVEEPAA